MDEFFKKIKINEDINKCILACEEIYINICRYAYPDNCGDIDIKCEYESSRKKILVEFIDSGKKFDPTIVVNPQIHIPAEKREFGGLGIFISKNTSDCMKYSRIDDKNILKIIKHIKEC